MPLTFQKTDRNMYLPEQVTPHFLSFPSALYHPSFPPHLHVPHRPSAVSFTVNFPSLNLHNAITSVWLYSQTHLWQGTFQDHPTSGRRWRHVRFKLGRSPFRKDPTHPQDA